MKLDVHSLAAAALLSLAAAPLAHAQATVGVTDFAFSPQTVTISVGGSVTWNNTQGSHNVVADDPNGYPDNSQCFFSSTPGRIAGG